jgi:hypothetical protein
MKLKKFLPLILIFVLTGCGYQSIYTSKNHSDFTVKKIILDGNKDINKKIISLTNIQENNKENSDYNLILKSEKKIEIIAKDKAGNPSIYKTTILVMFILKDDDKTISEKLFNESFSYNSMSSKFDLKKYQKDIGNNLINIITDKILIYINS